MDAVAMLGLITIAAFLVITLTTRFPVVAALILVPVITSVFGGFAPSVGTHALDGIKLVMPVAAMIFFAILYFGLMLDNGLFEPMIGAILQFVHDDPLRLCIASVILPMLIALDGDGTTTFLISITALLPVHRRLGIQPLILPCLVGMAAGVMNMLPWGGPTARAMAALGGDISDIFTPVVPAMAAGIAWVLAVAVWMGLQERRRLGNTTVDAPVALPAAPSTPANGIFWFNLGLTVVVVLLLFRDLYAAFIPLPEMHSALVFMAAFAIALPINCRSTDEQARQLASHAPSIVSVTSMVLAAGVFTGLLNGTGMTRAMAEMLAGAVPHSLGPWLATIVAVTGMPLSLVLPPDAYYFGVLPVFAEAAKAMGEEPMAIGRGAILGQMTTGFPISPLTASTFILIGLSGVTLRDHQRFMFKWAVGTTIVMTMTAFAIGAL